MNLLNHNSIESSELVTETFKFWFNTNNHIRSPFPEYIHLGLKTLAIDKFFKWSSGLNPKAKDDVNDEIIAEKFEEIIFETALGLVHTEDEIITINFPFLPRLNDKITGASGNESIITDRNLVNEGDSKFLWVKLIDTTTNMSWETKFELPA